MSYPRSEAELAEHATRLGDDPGLGLVGQVRVLESVRDRLDEAAVEDLTKRLARAYGYFSHLWGKTVTVGVVEEHHESWDDPAACVGPRNYVVFVTTEYRLSNRTLFHELAHLEIHARKRAGHDVPTSSEEFCDVYAIARMPPELVDTEKLAYLGKPTEPPANWPDICRRALAYREEHGANSHYIQRCREWLGVGGDPG